MDRGPSKNRPRGTRPTTREPREPRDRGGGPQTERTDVLIQRYLDILGQDPRESFAWNRLLDLYRDRDGNLDALQADLAQRAAADPRAFAPRMLLGHLHKAHRRMDEARAAYAEASALRPEDPVPLAAMARIDRAAGRAADAAALFERAVTHTRDDTARRELLRELGELSLEQERWDDARAAFERIAAGAQGNVYLLTEYARALSSRGQHARAVEEYQRVVRALRGDNRVLGPVLRDLGRAQLDAGQVDEAIATLDRALATTGRTSGVRAEIYDVLVEAYRRGERLAELVTRLQGEGRRFETLELLGRLQDELGNDAEALEAYRGALVFDRRHIDTRVRIIQLLTRSGRLAEVVVEYRALIAVAPREPRFVVDLAELLMQTGERTEALRLADQVSRANARESSIHQALAELFARWGEEERATREIELLVRADPRDPANLVALGAQQLAAGNREAALATWRRVLGVERGAEGHAVLAGVLADHDELDLAEEQYREAVRLEPDSMDYVRGLANVLERVRTRERGDERARRDEQAVTLWARVLELAGEDRAARREARQRVVGIRARRGELPAWISRWQQAFAADPPDVQAGQYLAEAYLRSRPSRVAEADRVLARISELAPGDVETLLALERVRTASGDLAGAIDVLARLVEADPRRAASYLSRMAQHAHALYRDDDAIRYAAGAVERAPDDALAHRRLGDLYRARQEMDAAIRSYRRAIELDDRLFPTYLELAELHLAKNELAPADELFRRVLRGSPDDDLVARAGRASLQIHLGAETLLELEQDILPLALAHTRRPIFRRMVVELYDALATPLVLAAQETTERGAEAREQLRRIGTRALKPLLEALVDDDPAQRQVAVDLLGHLGNPNAAGPLLTAAEADDAGLPVRARALLAAGAVATDALAPRFVAIATGPQQRLRGIAAWGLARMGGRRAVAELRALVDNGDPAVRAFAALGLGQAADAASGEALAGLLRQDRNESVVACAAWALGRLRGPQHVPALLASLSGREGLVARAAAAALGETGDSRARAALAEAVFDTDPSLRESASSALTWISRHAGPTDEPLPVPRRPLAAPAYLAWMLGQRVATSPGPADLEPHLDVLAAAAGDALRGPPERVQAALDVLSAPAGGIALAPWLGGDDENSRRLRATLAEQLTDDLVRASDHPQAVLRVLALRILGGLPGAEVSVALASALDADEPEVVRAALAGLAARHEPSEATVRRVAAILADDAEWDTRLLAARALGRVGGPVATQALATALERDAYAFVREAAAEALGRLGGGVDALRAASEGDAEPSVRRAAAAALERRD